MGNIGPGELLVIGVLALLIFGPKRLPEIARSVGKALREFKRATGEFTEELKSGLEEPRPSSQESDVPPEKPRELRPGPRG